MRLYLFLLLSLLAFGGDDIYQSALQAKGRSEADLTRDETSKPAEVMAFAKVQPGMKVLDILGGGGYYSELLAAVVGENGQIYLHNNKAYLPYVDKELAARLADGRLKNVVDWQRETDNLELPEASFDGVFFVLGFHDLYYKDTGWDIDPKGFMDQLQKSIKPGGFLLVVDHAATAGSGSEAAQKLHRIDEAFAQKAIESFGFKFQGKLDVLKNPADTHETTAFDPSIRRKTDRFVLLFRKAS